MWCGGLNGRRQLSSDSGFLVLANRLQPNIYKLGTDDGEGLLSTLFQYNGSY